MTGLAHHHTIYIRCRAAELWAALTESEQTPKWFLGTTIESSFEVGAGLRLLAHGQGEEWETARVEAIVGKILEVEPKRRLVYEFRFCDLDDPASELAWTISEVPNTLGVVRLDVDHRGFEGESASWQRTRAGWPVILSSLKTWIETSTPLEISG